MFSFLNPFRKPSRAIIETTNRCNLNCPFCMVGLDAERIREKGSASHDTMTRSRGMMSPETFDAVLENLVSFRIRKAYLHFQGEPFLNRHTPLFASRLKRAGIRVSVFTNGQAFTDENISELADAEIDCIRFSVDGASESTYGKNRVGGRFETVYTNMEKVRLAHEGKNTRIEWQFLALKNNEHEIPEARKLADRLGVHFFVKGFRETDPALAPENPKYRARRLQKPCTDIYLQLGIYWNGDVVPCCYDVDAHEVMGNVLENGLKTIWHSPKYRDFRRRVDRAHTRPSNEPCLCRHCLRWGP